jgi:hypothetical protein
MPRRRRRRRAREDVGLGRVAQPPHRLRLGLLVEGQAVVDAAVEVDRELRKPQQGPGVGQHDAAVGQREAPGETQLAVEPRVQQRTAVHLDRCLQPAARTRGRLRLELEAGGVGVRAEDLHRA